MWTYHSAVSLFVVVSLVACQDSTSVPSGESDETSKSHAKTTVPDEQAETLTTVAAPATIQAFFVTDLYAKDSGYVSQINNDIGDHVKAGQVLAIIKDPELHEQFEKVQAAVLQA